MFTTYATAINLSEFAFETTIAPVEVGRPEVAKPKTQEQSAWLREMSDFDRF